MTRLSMTRLSMTRLSLALLVPACLACAAAAPATQYRFVEHADTDATHVHGGSAPDNVGDILTFTNPIYDATNTSRVGADQGYCVRLLVGKAYECHWTLTVQDGQIMVDGPFFDASDSVMAITGGTGRFSGAHGQMHLHARDAHGSAYDFTYELVLAGL